MRIPTSTLVMGLLTCVPFGLAIRDTAAGKTGAYVPGEDEDEDHDEYGGEAFEARMRAAEEAAEAAEQEAQALRAQQLVQIYGAEPASLGAVFEGLRVGAPEAALGGATMAGIHRLERTSGIKIELLHGAGMLDAVLVRAARTSTEDEQDELCETLEQRLTTAWGEGETDADDRVIWLNPVAGHRAVLADAPACELRFERYAAVDTWFAPTSPTSVVPVWAIGQPARRLVEALGPAATVTGDVITWRAPGVGAGTGDTMLFAEVQRGKVVSLDAAFDESLVEQVGVHLIGLHGEPTAEGDNLDLVRWRSKPPISLEAVSGARAHLRVGKQP